MWKADEPQSDEWLLMALPDAPDDAIARWGQAVGCAFCPACGHLWVDWTGGPTLREYLPADPGTRPVRPARPRDEQRDAPAVGETERGVAALLPFVRAWNLSLNPEDLAEMARAVLTHARSGAPIALIADAVREQLAGYDSADERIRQAQRTAADDGS